MSTYSNQTDYVGNWRGELVATVASGNATATQVFPTLTASIGRKGTGTLVTATYNYKIGTSSGGTQIASGGKSLDKAGWTSSGQSRQIWTGNAPTITRTSSNQTQTYYGSYQYKTSSTTSNWYTTNVVVTIYPTLTIAGNSATKTFSTSSQSVTVTAASGGTGSYTYSKVAETNASGTTTTYITVAAGSLTIAANTPPGTYTVKRRVTDSEGAVADATHTITISKATNPIAYANQTWASHSFSTSAQTMTLAAATSAQGTITYALQSQKNSGGTAVSYFSFNTSTRVLTQAASTPVGTYTVVVRATAAGNTNYNSGYKDSTITVTIAKATSPMTYAAQSWSCSFSTSAQTKTLSAAASAQGTATYSLQSQKQGSTTVTYFTFNTSTRVLTMAANTPPNTYTVVVRAHDPGNGNYNAKDVDSTITVTVSKATNPLAYTATQSYSKTFSTSAQTQATTAATGAQGTLSYAINSQKNSGGTAVSYFTLSTTTLTVAANTPAGTYTIVIRATAAGNTNYNSGTKDSTITFTINKATPTLSVTGATLNYNSSAQALATAWSVTGGGTIYLGLGTSSTTAPTSWSTNASPTATNVGTYYLWAKADASTNYNAVTQVYKTTAVIKPVMWLKFHANGGTIADSPHQYDTSNYFKLNNSIVQRSATSTGTYSDLVYTVTTSTTYLNLWNVSSYNITRPGYKIKSGTAAFNTATNGTGIDVNQDNTAAGDTNPITSKRLNGGTEITANVTKTLYVNWVADTFTITLDKNATDATAGTTSVQITYGTAQGSYPSITKPTRPGYTFAGYYSATSGGTQWYDANGNSVRTFDLTANTTWYAQWTINSYTLTIDPNGGTWNSSTSTSTASQNYATTKAIAAPTRTGYTFVGWAETGPGSLAKITQTDPAFDSSSGGVTVYNNSGGGTVTHTRQSSSAGTAYGSYEILINSTSGTTSPGNGGFIQNTTSAANKKYIHAFVAKIPTGYTVLDAKNATGDGRTVTWLTDRNGTGAFRVYAYQHNCGSTGTFSTFGHVYLDTGSRPVSWQLAYSSMLDITDGTANTYTYGAGAGRLTALWAGNQYSVVFNANGGSGTMSNQTGFFYGTAKALSANGFTAPSGGYTFQGWATSAANAAAGTVAYANQANMTTGTTTNGGTVTLYAVWKRTITFKHGQANATTGTATQYYGGNLTPPAITAISGWTALGWRDDTSAGTKEYGANNTTAFAYTATATTLYAVYSRELTITYAANGGSGTDPSPTKTTQYYNSNGAITSPSVTLATNPYTKTNPDSTFNGWLVSTSNTTVASGGSYTWSIAVDATTVSRTATAQWLINLVLTPTAYSGAYNGSSHSASIKSNVADTTVGYSSTSGNYTDYTATVGTSNVTLSGVSYVDFTNGAKTVYYRGTKSGYTTVTGTTTINITKRTVTWSAPTVNSSTLTYDGSAKTLATTGSASTGGTMYYYVSTSGTAPTFSTSTWKTSIDTKIDAGTYYIYYRCYVSDTTNNTGTNINTTYSINKTISQRTVTPTAPTLTTNTLTYDGNAKTLANAGSCTTGGTMYYYVSTSATAPTFDTSTWKTSIDTKTDAGTYYVHWYCYVSDTSNNTGTNLNTAKTLNARVINKASISPTVTMASWAYGGTASTPSVSGNTGGGSVTYTYKLKSAADSAYSSTKPSDAGAYTVKAVVGETANYLSGTATKDFNITFTATATARTADYTGSAQSATIQTSAPGVVVSYGTSTSYGYSVTCTSANTNYTMSGVSVTNVIDSPKTVYYSATKNGYIVTGSTTVTVNRVSAGTKPTTSVSKTYNGNNQNNGYTAPSGITMSGSNSGTNAGTYTAIYTPDNNHKWSDGTIDAVTVTLTINQRTVTPTAPTLTTGDLTYNGSSKTLANVGSCTTGGVMRYYVSTSSSLPSWSATDTNWKSSIDTKINAGTYYIYWYCYVEDTDNNTGTNINTAQYLGSRVINKAPISPSVTMSGWTYGETATNPSVSGNTGNGTVTYTYKVSTAADSTYTTTKPSNAGTYTVKASIATTDNYQAGTATTNFTIAKRIVTPTAPTLTTDTLTYNGSAKTLANTGSCTAGGVMYYYVGTSPTAPTFSTSTWKTSIDTKVDAGTYYVHWYCYVSDTNNNTGTNINTAYTLSARTINKATMTIVPIPYSDDYNGIAHSAQIKFTTTSVTNVNISYGTSTDYGQSLTAATANTNYSMSSVTRTNPGTTTVYYKATKANYNDVTGSTTITITGVPVHNKRSNLWKHGIVYINVNGTWKKATIGYIKIDGSWRQITS